MAVLLRDPGALLSAAAAEEVRSIRSAKQDCRAEWPTGEIARSSYFKKFISQHSPQRKIEILESSYKFSVS